MLEQAALLEEQYKGQSGGKNNFLCLLNILLCSQCLCRAFKGAEIDQYDVSLREAQTYEIIDDVAHMKSESGLLYYNDFNRPVLEN